MSNNLLYNSDLSHEKELFYATGVLDYDPAQNCLTASGNLGHYQLIPISTSDTYRISCEVKFNTTTDTYFYIRLVSHDSDKKTVPHYTVTKPHSNTETYLAKDLVSGDTVAVLEKGANWKADTTYRYLGICNNIAWDYNRCTNNFTIDSVSGNVVNLKEPYQGNTIPKGTKVAEFSDGANYNYPIRLNDIQTNPKRKEWHTLSATFTGKSLFYGTQYIYFGTLGYSNSYSIRNICIENLTTPQTCGISDSITEISNTGNVFSEVRETGRKIRYIRDTISGNTANVANHWCEIQAYNSVGENFAFNKNSKLMNADSWTKTLVTDGQTISNPYYPGSNGRSSYIDIDLGMVEQINSIKVWHYYADGRTYYDHKVEVSKDGVAWDVIYQGEHPETSDGWEIILRPETLKVYDGFIETNEIIET